MAMKCERLVVSLFLLSCCMGGARGSEPSSGEVGSKLRVGVVVGAPFAMTDGSGGFSGLAVEVWQGAARGLGWSYALTVVEREAAVEQLERGGLDVVIGDVQISPDLIRRVEYTVPYISCDLGIAFKPKARVGTLGVLLRTFFSFGFLKVVLSTLGILVLVGGIILLVERGWRQEEFGRGRGSGALYGIYWAAAMMSGVGERTPTTGRGRALALLWIFSGIFITSSFTAAITGRVTAEALVDQAPTRRDLPRLRVAVVDGTFEDALRRLGGRVEIFGSEHEALQAVADGRADACVGSEVVLRHEIGKAFGGMLEASPVAHRQTLQGFALPHGSPLRFRLNQAIIAAIFDPAWIQTKGKYLN